MKELRTRRDDAKTQLGIFSRSSLYGLDVVVRREAEMMDVLRLVG